MIQTPGLSAFFVKTGQHLWIARHSLGQGLDRNLAADLAIDGAIDNPHTAAAQHLDHIVFADALGVRSLVVLAESTFSPAFR